MFPGNSGQVVYAVHANENILYPLGILVGEPKLHRPKCGTSVYYAALLAPNLEAIAEKFQPFVSNLSHRSCKGLEMKGILEILSTTKHSTMKIRKRNGGGSARPPWSMMQSTPDASSTLNASHQTSNTEDKIHNRQSNVDDSGLFSKESTQNFAD